jgi:hypothetical protein
MTIGHRCLVTDIPSKVESDPSTSPDLVEKKRLKKSGTSARLRRPLLRRKALRVLYMSWAGLARIAQALARKSATQHGSRGKEGEEGSENRRTRSSSDS